MSCAADTQTSALWASDARRRSFAWAVAAGKRRAQLGRHLGLSAPEAQALLASPGMGMLAWVWHGFKLHRRRGGLRDVFEMIMVLFRDVLEDRHGCRLRLVDLLGLLMGLVGYALLGVTRDLCAEIDRHARRGSACASPLGPVRLRMVHAMAELIERVVAARLRVLRAADVAIYEQDFRELALEGRDPFLELLVTEVAPTDSSTACPAPLTAGTASAVAPPRPPAVMLLADDARFKRRRRSWPPLVRPPPIECAA